MKVSVLVFGKTSGKLFMPWEELSIPRSRCARFWYLGFSMILEWKVPLTAWKLCLQFCHDLETYFPTLQNVYSFWAHQYCQALNFKVPKNPILFTKFWGLKLVKIYLLTTNKIVIKVFNCHHCFRWLAYRISFVIRTKKIIKRF